MPLEFVRETCTAYGHYTVCDSTKLVMAYDGSGRRVSKTRMKKTAFDGPWYADLVTHYTGIGTEIRENMPGGTLKDVRVVVNMPVFFRVTLTRLKPRSYIEKDILRLSNGGAILPKQSFGASRQGLGRYGVEDAADAFRGVPLDENGKPTSWSALNPKFEWYLKNHLGSTMLVYGTAAYDDSYFSNFEGGVKAAYDYRAFGEQIDLVSPSSGKVTENFTGKEKDDETQLDYFGARYLDPMLGMWTSVDPARQFASPYLYAGNGFNPVNVVDPDGNAAIIQKNGNKINVTIPIIFSGEAATPSNIKKATNWIAKNLSGKFGKYNLKTEVVKYDIKKHGVTYNVVMLSDGPSSKCERGSCAKPANMIPNIAYMDVNSEFVVTHEIAHLIGLDDKYYRDPVKNYMNYKLYTPYPGYDDNLMGGHGKFKLEEWQIEEMWGPGRSDFNDVEPRNRYKANDIREVK